MELRPLTKSDYEFLVSLQRQDDVYQTLCSRSGAQLDGARYVQGWQEGKYEFDRRKVHGGSE